MTKYTGPVKPTPVRREIISDRAEAIIFIVLAIVAALLVYFGE